MGRRPRTFQPNAVLQSAIYSGLAALVRLARGRVRSKKKKYYKSIEKNWMKAWKKWEESRLLDPYDFSSIQNAEPNLRGAFLNVLWQSTKRYGNRETKRVYSWLEGTVGPLNALLNYAGARLRDLALTHYQFPDPIYYEVRVYDKNTTKVFPKSVAEKYPNPNAIKTYNKAGYPGNQYGPRILLAHPTLPGMDFVDMIRAHLVELCKQLFIYNVPRTEAHRYIRLLIHMLRPYLDWVYTQGRTGKRNFNPESDRELKKVVNEIKVFQGKNVGRYKSVTKTIEGSQLPDTIKEVRGEIEQKLKKTRDKTEKKRIKEILDQIDQEILQDKDVQMLRDQVLSLSQREGNYWHRLLLSDLHHPASLKQVVFAGDKMLEETSPVLIVGELPVDKRTGQIDITFFLRREIPGQTIMTPILILEIKSKTGFCYNLYGVRTRNKKKKDYGPRLFAWKRKLNDDEWNTISKAKPLKDTMGQLDAYETVLLQEYRSLVPSDPTPPKELWKGVVVLDTDQKPLDVFDAFCDLLDELVTTLVNDMVDSSSFTSYIPDPKSDLRLALILTPSEGPSELVHQMSPPESITEEDPFQDRVSDDRILTLYVSVPSSTSSGTAAAGISTNWHLINHIEDCIEKKSEKTEVYWLDLMGTYKEIEVEYSKNSMDSDESGDREDERVHLINRRFGLDKMLTERGISRRTHRQLTDLLKRMKFVDLSSEIDTILLKNETDFSKIVDTVQSNVPSDRNTERIIVLDGWSEFRDLVSREHKPLVRSLERTFLDVLPEKDTELIWIDSGVSHTRMNPTYQQKCIRPIPHDSHRRKHLDEIIYNIPTTPRVFGWQTPRREDIRVIIQDTPTSADPWSQIIDVPLLRNMTRKVRGVSIRDRLVPDEDLIQPARFTPMHGRGITLSTIATSMYPLTEDTVEQIKKDSVTLIPSTLRSRGKEPEEEVTEVDEEEEEVKREIDVHVIASPPKTVSLTKRMVLDPTHPPPPHPRAREQYHEAKKINRAWRYDSFPVEEEEDDYPVSKPPLIELSTSQEIDTTTCRELELRRTLYTAQYLMRKLPSYEDLYHCCERIVSTVSPILRKKREMKTGLVLLRLLKDVRSIIRKESGNRQVWETLLPMRKDLVTLLNSENRKSLEDTLAQNSDVLELYGNNLFLAMCATMDELVSEEAQKPAMAIQLWSAIAQWVPYQLGFKTQSTMTASKYDLRAIHSDLRMRTKSLVDRVPVIQRLEIQNYGQMLWSEEEGIFSSWVIFPSAEEMVGGYVTGLGEPFLRAKWYDCVKDVGMQSFAARRATSSTTRTPIMTHQYGSETILWALCEDDEEPGVFWLPFILEYPSREGVLLPWFKLSELSSSLFAELQPPTSVEVPPYTVRNIDRFLQSVIETTKDPIEVTCEVSIDLESKLFQIDFTQGGKTVETLKYRETYKLLQTLRHPIREGSAYETSSGNLLTWDHRNDIEYHDVTMKRDDGRTETISLTLLKPFVHRNRFFPDEYSIPKTCSELLSTEECDTLTLSFVPEDSSFRSIKLEFDGLSYGSSLHALETICMNIYDVALLTECEQLVDTERGTRHRMEINAKGLFDLQFSRLSDYPRLQEAITGLDIIDYDWSRDSWTIKIDTTIVNKNEIRWYLMSGSGMVWQRKVYDFVMDYTLSIDEVINEFKVVVNKTIPLKHISGLSEVTASLRSTLRNRGWRRGKPRCRISLEDREGGYVAVVNRLGPEGVSTEIDSFRVEVDADTSVLIDILEGEEGPLSFYDVVNSEEFYKSVINASSEVGDKKQEEEWKDEEAEFLWVISEWREEKEKGHPLAQRFLGETLALLASFYLSQNRLPEALNFADESVNILQAWDEGGSSARLSLARAFAVKADVFLIERRDISEVKSLLQKAHEQIGSLKPDTSVSNISKWIEKLSRRVSSE
jgi:hypothetical protein